MEPRFFISGNVPSSKNSQQWTGKFLVKSKTCQKYLKDTGYYWLTHAEEFRTIFDKLPKPVRINFKFIRGSKHKFDYINACQYPCDLMVKYGWVPDDNSDEILPIFEPYEYSKTNPGVWISISIV